MSTKDIKLNREYWDSFYRQQRGHVPSQFCVSFLPSLAVNSVVVELGCGNGRDAHYFASQGHITVAMDISPEAIRSCEAYASDTGSSHSKFFRGDLACRDDLATVIEYARNQAEGREISFYSRFVMHALDHDQESMFLHHMAELVNFGEPIFFEFRSQEDAGLSKIYGDHYRRYIDTEKFTRLLQEAGFEIEYRITGRGMAGFREEDPYVSRVIARKA